MDLRPTIRSTLLLAGAVGALVLGGRMWLLRQWGSALPFWDQWDAEATLLYLPWLRGELTWSALFGAHNEHRIVLTRLADLAVFSLAGGWNTWWQLILNAALHALTAAGLTLNLAPALSRRGQAGLAVGLALLFSGTTGWQNALWGFQSQFYFASLLAVAAIAWTITTPPLRPRWWLGWLAAALALFSHAGGFFGAAAALGVAAVASLSATAPGRRWTGLGLLALVPVAGFLLRAHVVQHDALQAQNAGQFLTMLARCLAWPFIDRPWLAPVLQLPVAALLWVRSKNRTALSTVETCAVAFALLWVLNAAAIAYSRGGALADTGPLSRYQDSFLPGMAAQLFAALRLAGEFPRLGRPLALAWSGVLAAALLAATTNNLSVHLPVKRALDGLGIVQVRSYLVDPTQGGLQDPLAARALHPSRLASVQAVLDQPELRAVLPADLLAPPDSPLRQPPFPIRHGGWLALVNALFFGGLLCLRELGGPADPSRPPRPSRA